MERRRSCLQVKKTRRLVDKDRQVEMTRSNSASTSTKSPRLRRISWIPVISPLASMLSNSIGTFLMNAGSCSNGESGACAEKMGGLDRGVSTSEEDVTSDFLKKFRIRLENLT